MDKQRAKDIIACRCAQELKDGYVVNLGIGIPTQCARYFPKGVDITLHAELGLIGQGPAPTPEQADPLHVVDASGNPATIIPGGAIVDSATNFGLIRGGHVDACVLGALEADAEGSFGNWLIPGKKLTGMGGAMDLCAGVKKIIVATDHCEKSGKSKILKKCTLPLTGAKCVTDIVTERCYFEVTPEGLVLRELAAGYTVDDIKACTEADFIVPDEIGVME